MWPEKENYEIHQELRDKLPERQEKKESVVLMRLQLYFGLSVAVKGQAETFVFHYVVSGI